MQNIFLVTQFIKMLHAPICLYDSEGNFVRTFEEIGEQKLITKEDVSRKIPKDFPYICVKQDGTAFALLWDKKEKLFVGIGKVNIYDKAKGEDNSLPFCEKDTFAAGISSLWNIIRGVEVGIGELWERNINSTLSPNKQVTNEIIQRQQSESYHNPYEQELREQDSIRRGDEEALRKSINEVYSGTLGTLADDVVRQSKNIAICVIAISSRSAIAGGLNPELAFTMTDAFIRNIEENLTEPVKIEKATRDAEYEFTRMVHRLNTKDCENPMINRVRDYVFCHIHKPILVRDIADYIGVTPNYLSEQFHQAMGMTLKQYIIEQKIVSSENLLKYTNYSLEEISSLCAFSSQSRFSTYFQRKNGITPARYRKKFKMQETEEKLS
ncbi:MAG: AraC family transcriptional regulator [Butyribacter sp.]|nr:AraC family transcriptional regulator [bacterium]MDY3854319.1 AraC family transcriptional regulator [Butyribacter sp.]